MKRITTFCLLSLLFLRKQVKGNHYLGTLCLLLAFCFSFNQPPKRTIWLIGDSTMAAKKTERAPESGWGASLAAFVQDELVVRNYAASGRSSLSFIREKRWKSVLDSIRPGDFVVIEFGHNDEKRDSNLYTEPFGSYQENLLKFVEETRSKGGNPILCSSIVRRHFDAEGRLVNSLTDYVRATQVLAKRSKTPYIDLEARTHRLVEALGPQASWSLYNVRKKDSTHLTFHGADVVAQLFVQEVKRQKLPLSAFLKPSIPPVVKNIRVAQYRSNKACALSYTFDDGLKEHYTLVFPKFKQLGFKGTFWINGNTINQGELGLQTEKPRTSWAELKEMADQGQEISNHGWSHKSLPRISKEEVRVEIDRNDSIIEAIIGKRPVTYCYAGNALNPEIVRMASEHRVGTRTEQFSLGSKSTPESLERRIDTLLATHGWGVAMTHGITYGYDAFRNDTILWDHLARVKALEKQIWVAPFKDIAAYTAEQKNIQLEINRRDRKITIKPCLTLDRNLFNEPLTLVLECEGYPLLTARQGHRTLPVRYSDRNIQLEFEPAGGVLILHLQKL